MNVIKQRQIKIETGGSYTATKTININSSITISDGYYTDIGIFTKTSTTDVGSLIIAEGITLDSVNSVELTYEWPQDVGQITNYSGTFTSKFNAGSTIVKSVGFSDVQLYTTGIQEDNDVNGYAKFDSSYVLTGTYQNRYYASSSYDGRQALVKDGGGVVLLTLKSAKVTYTVDEPVVITTDKLTPKTDFVFSTGQPAPYNNVIYNKNGTIKKNSEYTYETNAPYIKSVGNGEVAWIDVQGTELRLVINPKNNYQSVRKVVIDTYDSANKYYETIDIFSFLGKCFPGDDDRYVILSMKGSGPDTTKYYATIYNIDKMEVLKTFPATASTGTWHSFHYNGVDKVYVNKTIGGLVLELNINDESSRTLTDDTGVNLVSKFIAFVDDIYLYFKDRDETKKLKRIALSSSVVSTRSDVEITSCIVASNGENGFDNRYTKLIYSQTDGDIFYMNSNTVNSRVSLKDAIMGATSGAQNHTAQLVLNFEENEDTITFDLVISRSNNAGDTSFANILNIVITKADNSVTATRYDSNTTSLHNGIIPQERLNISFHNSCNSYNIGKFYDYGLQVQWNNRN